MPNEINKEHAASFVIPGEDLTSIGVALVLDFDQNFMNNIEPDELKHLIRMAQILGVSVSVISADGKVHKEALERIAPRGELDLRTFAHYDASKTGLNERTIGKTLGQISCHQGILDCSRTILLSTEPEHVHAVKNAGFPESVLFGSKECIRSDVKKAAAAMLGSVKKLLDEYLKDLPGSSRNARLKSDMRLFTNYLKNNIEAITNEKKQQKKIVEVIDDKKLERKFSTIKKAIARDMQEVCQHWRESFIAAENVEHKSESFLTAVPVANRSSSEAWTATVSKDFSEFRLPVNDPVSVGQSDRYKKNPDKTRKIDRLSQKAPRWK